MPSPPGDEDEDFILVHRSDVQMSDKAQQAYTQLMTILREQYEVQFAPSHAKCDIRVIFMLFFRYRY